MGDPRDGVWSIFGQELYDALLRVETGESAEMVWIEMCANTTTQPVETE